KPEIRLLFCPASSFFLFLLQMKKTQIILVLCGLALAVFLFRLPKTLVADDRRMVEADQTEHEEGGHAHDEREDDVFARAHGNASFSVDDNQLSLYKKQF